MNLGIAGRKAIVCASSRGLGKACARALAEAGCEVVINGRDSKKLEAAATELSSFAGVKVIPVVANVAVAIELIQKVIDPMCERKFGRIVNITSASVKMPLAGLDLSSGARAGLTAFLAGVARTVADKNVTINNILPGAFDTDRLRGTLSKTAEQKGKSVDEVAAERIAGIPAKRFGTPDEFGAACAFLCSAHAGYITGQNLLIDGGTFNGAL